MAYTNGFVEAGQDEIRGERIPGPPDGTIRFSLAVPGNGGLGSARPACTAGRRPAPRSGPRSPDPNPMSDQPSGKDEPRGREPPPPGKRDRPRAGEPTRPPPDTAFEDYPLTRGEYISAMVHFYRGELAHADAWRARLDPTTNWAIVTAGAMLSFSFNSPAHSHVTLLLALVLVSIFLLFEARRFRYFDAWRARVRLFEENFWIPMFRRNLVSPQATWGEAMARDLDQPTFKLSFLAAVGVRLRFNYLWIYGALLLAWLAKLNIHPAPAASFGEVVRRMAVGVIPGSVVLGLVGAWMATIVFLALHAGHERQAVDEVAGVEKGAEVWKM